MQRIPFYLWCLWTVWIQTSHTFAQVPEFHYPGRVLDFQKLAPNRSSQHSEKERVVVFALSGAPTLEQPEALIDGKGKPLGQTFQVTHHIHGFEHAREVFESAFPLKRHHFVLTARAPEAALRAAQSLTVEQLAAAAGGDRFIAHSLQHADWVGIPWVDAAHATWQRVGRTRTLVVDGRSVEQPYTAWDFHIDFAVQMAIFKRNAAGFVAWKTLRGSSGQMLGVGLGNEDAAPDDPSYLAQLSAHPMEGCGFSEPSVDSQAAPAGTPLSECPGYRFVSYRDEPSIPGSGQSAKHACQGVNDDVNAPNSMTQLATCGVRVAAERAALSVAQESKHMDGWTLFASLQQNPTHSDALSIALGNEEGVQRGDGYTALDAAGTQVAFARVTHVGPGGMHGERNPSDLVFRIDDAPLGSRMKELAQQGIEFEAGPALTTIASGSVFESPAFAGFHLGGGYNLTRVIPFGDEIWLRAQFGMGWNGAAESAITLEVLPQITFYGRQPWNYILGVGFGMTALGKTLDEQKYPRYTKEQRTLGAASAGIPIMGGVEFLLSPRWFLSAALTLRVNLSKAKITDGNNSEYRPELASRGETWGNAGNLFNAGLNMSAHYMF